MVLAHGIAHTSRALNAQSAVDEMTNAMFRRNAETLKQGQDNCHSPKSEN